MSIQAERPRRNRAVPKEPTRRVYAANAMRGQLGRVGAAPQDPVLAVYPRNTSTTIGRLEPIASPRTKPRTTGAALIQGGSQRRPAQALLWPAGAGLVLLLVGWVGPASALPFTATVALVLTAAAAVGTFLARTTNT